MPLLHLHIVADAEGPGLSDHGLLVHLAGLEEAVAVLPRHPVDQPVHLAPVPVRQLLLPLGRPIAPCGAVGAMSANGGRAERSVW